MLQLFDEAVKISTGEILTCTLLVGVKDAVNRPRTTAQVCGSDPAEGQCENAVIRPKRNAHLVDTNFGRMGFASASSA